LSVEVSLQEVAKWCQYYSGADLQALLYNAQLQAVHEMLDADEDGPPQEGHSVTDSKIPVHIIHPNSSSSDKTSGGERDSIRKEMCNLYGVLMKDAQIERKLVSAASKTPVISLDHLREAFRSSTPSVSAKERSRYEAIYAKFVSTRGDFGMSHPVDSQQTLA
jgi:peroxin-1